MVKNNLDPILSREERDVSNQKARSTWERKAVGNHRAEGAESARRNITPALGLIDTGMRRLSSQIFSILSE